MTKYFPKTNANTKPQKKTKRKKRKFNLLVFGKIFIWVWLIFVISVLIVTPVRNYLVIKAIQNWSHPELGKLITIKDLKFNIWDMSITAREFGIKNPFPFPSDLLLRFENFRIEPILFNEEKFAPALLLSSEKFELNIYKLPDYGTNIIYLMGLMKATNNIRKASFIIPFLELSFSKGEITYSQSIEPISIPLQCAEDKTFETRKYAYEEIYVIKLNTYKYDEVMEKIIETTIIKNTRIPESVRNKYVEELTKI